MTNQTACANCGLDLFGNYHRWLMLKVDHVVPTGVARRLEISADLYKDLIYLVLACAGCNGFDTRYSYPVGISQVWTMDVLLAATESPHFQDHQYVKLTTPGSILEGFEFWTLTGIAASSHLLDVAIIQPESLAGHIPPAFFLLSIHAGAVALLPVGADRAVQRGPRTFRCP